MLRLVQSAKHEEFLEGNCKLARGWLANKYELHTASSLLTLMSEFHNSKLDSIDKDPDKWISIFEGL